MYRSREIPARKALSVVVLLVVLRLIVLLVLILVIVLIILVVLRITVRHNYLPPDFCCGSPHQYYLHSDMIYSETQKNISVLRYLTK